MIRALGVCVAVVALAGCSMGSQNLSMGFNDQAAEPEPKASLFSGGFPARTPDASTQAPAPSGDRTRVASLGLTGPQTRPPAARRSLARPSAGTALDRKQALKVINAYRKQKGLRALKLDNALEKAARLHSRDLAKWDRISHFG
ncbi:MAG: CAP domain-containing protein, partial [Pseudomonadota bacterium]